ncbi:MAG: F0F1 ATP synthase subunit epsilon [Bacteroidales bacterium]|nr:F0F1 ATP synthase subunit epsilon [Bacteroidales bacterium]
MKTLLLTLLSPEETADDRTILKAIFPGETGSFEILPDHAPMVATLAEGDIVYTTEDSADHRLHVKSGVVEVCRNKLSVCFEK